MKDSFYSIMMKVGASTGCHQMPSRSFFFRGYQFPLCARCTGLVAGYAIGAAMWFVYRLPWEICITLMLILLLDWTLQYLDLCQSNNGRRFVTGVLCGVGYLQLWLKLILLAVEKYGPI